jgi:hypothetical protein
MHSKILSEINAWKTILQHCIIFSKVSITFTMVKGRKKKVVMTKKIENGNIHGVFGEVFKGTFACCILAKQWYSTLNFVQEMESMHKVESKSTN